MLTKLHKTCICAGLVLATAFPALAARTYVRGYYRKDGTYVRGYYRGGPSSGTSNSPSSPSSPGNGSPGSPADGKSPSPLPSGLPTDVKGYFRRDGTYVRAHVRSRVDGAAFKTLSFRHLDVDRDGSIGPGSELRYVMLPKQDLSFANLAGVDLKGSQGEGGELSHANLTGATLTEAKLRGAKLREAVLDDADLFRAELDEADLTGVQAQAARFDGAKLGSANLQGADLSDASLVGVDLASANLESAKLVHSRLALANLAGANLTGADLRGADLSSARISQADLTGAIYSNSTEWPNGFNPTDAGAILKEDESAPAGPGGADAQALLAQINAAVEAGDLAGAEKLTEQLSTLLKQAKTRKEAEPQAPKTDKSPEDPVEEPAAEGSRIEHKLQASPASVELPGGLKGQLFFPSGTAYVMYGKAGELIGNVSSRVTVRIPDAVVTDNRLFKVGQRVLRVTYASTNPEVAAVDASGSLSINGPGRTEIAVRAANLEWKFPLKVVHLTITGASSPEEIQATLGAPADTTGGLWVWKKYPGLKLKLRIASPVRIQSDWDEHPEDGDK